MRTAIGATAVNIAKPTNLGVPMIHAFLDNIRYITIELNGPTSETPGRRSEPHPFAKVGLSQKFVSEITFSNLRFLCLSVTPPTSMDTRLGNESAIHASRPSPGVSRATLYRYLAV
jgi:hypothetical protein